MYLQNLIPYTLNVCGSELTQFGSIYCSSDAILAYLYPVPMDRKPLGINKTKDNGLFQCSFSVFFMLLLPYLPNGCKLAVFELTISQDVYSLRDFVQITLNLEQFYGKTFLY